MRPAVIELSEEFRQLFNLWEDGTTGTYYYFDEAGLPVKAAEKSPEGVRVLSSLVMRYQAAKQMVLALYVDSVRHSEAFADDSRTERLEGRDIVVDYIRVGDRLGGGPFSRLLGKRLLPPPATEKSELWPYAAAAGGFEEFVIAVDQAGTQVRHTSDPGQLANYFGANPESPHYLTPVFFRPDVLREVLRERGPLLGRGRDTPVCRSLELAYRQRPSGLDHGVPR